MCVWEGGASLTQMLLREASSLRGRKTYLRKGRKQAYLSGRASPAEETAHAKALRHRCVWHVREKPRGLALLEL